MTCSVVNVRFPVVRLILAELTVQTSKRRVVLLTLSAMLNEIAVAGLIVSVCLLLHVAGLLLMAEWLLQRREYLARKGARIRYAILMFLLFTGIMLLHICETAMWAVFYYTRGLFQDL